MSINLPLQILGISVSVPKHEIGLESFKKQYGDAEVGRILKATGIESVRVAPAGMCASDLCADAAERLLASLSFDRSRIGGLVFLTQTPDYQMPSTACILQHRLKLPNRLAAYEINYGCSAYPYGLTQAAMLIHSGFADHVLVLAGDTLIRKTNPGDRSVRMVFGDAGTATLVGKGDNLFIPRLYTDGSGSESLIIPAGGERMPVSSDTSVPVTDSEGNVRTKNDVYMDGMAIMRFSLDKVPKLVDDLLDDAGWQKDDLESLLLHQANGFMLNYLRKKCKMKTEKVPVHVRKYGNTGPASISLAIVEEFGGGEFRPEKCVMAGFGVGLSWAGAATSLKGTHILPVGEL